MLQSVSRASTDSASTAVTRVFDGAAAAAGHAQRAHGEQDQVLGDDTGARFCPRSARAYCAARVNASVCVASTCSTSLVPTPMPSAPSPPTVEVWLSPQAKIQPGKREAELRRDDMDDALARVTRRRSAGCCLA